MTLLIARITVLILVAWLSAALLRHRSAASRHAVWMVALAGSLLMPATEWTMPKRVLTGPAMLISTPPVFVTADGDRTWPSLFSWIVAAWAGGTCLLITRFAMGHRKVSKVAANAKAAPDFNGIPVRISSEIRGPGVAGIWRHVILLPEDSSAWNPVQRASILAHEAEHAGRHDGVGLALGEIARAVYWFHPLIWLAFFEMRKESEKSCDDAAIRIGLRPSIYAGFLLQLARAFPTQPAMVSGWMPMAPTSQLENRMKAILDPTLQRSAARKGTWIFATAAGVALLLSLSSITLRAQEAKPENGAQENSNSKPIRVGGNVIAANLISKVNPTYPVAAKQRRAQGTVTLNVQISKQGVPEDIQAQPSDVDGELIGAAIEAVRQWRYKPTLLNGEPVEVITTVDIHFTLAP